MTDRPNILFFHVDNLGFGELSCYSGGTFRGAATERIDAFAAEGFRMTDYAPEAQCTPTRSALLTGRYAVRSGTHSVPIGASGGWGLVAWEKTLGDVLSAAGYACSVYGKWHVGEGPGRWPTDHGFREWAGPPRTYDEALWPDDPWYDPTRDPVSRMVSISAGETDVTEGDRLTLEVRRDVDLDYLDRARAFMSEAAADRTPFFVYFNHSLMHMPVLPRDEFRGRSGNGDWADSLLELDSDFGALLDHLERLGLTENTLVVFAGDNGPEEALNWRGSPGYWEGSYFAGGEGNLRTPCIVRWPGRVEPARVSNDIMHVTDWFATLVGVAGAELPDDRVIDGVDQFDWIAGRQPNSNREGFPYWMGAELYGVKWHDFKLVLKSQRYSTDPVGNLSSPHIVNLVTDPHEREPFNQQYLHSWTAYHFTAILDEFAATVRREPLIPSRSPLTHSPYGDGKSVTPR